MIGPFDLVVIATLTFGLVEFVKSLGVSGNKLRIFSMAIGGLLYGAFRLKEIFPEAAVWIDLALFVIGGGLSASGFFSFQKNRQTASFMAAAALAQQQADLKGTNLETLEIDWRKNMVGIQDQPERPETQGD